MAAPGLTASRAARRAAPAPANRHDRLAWIDDLRVAVIVGVIAAHVSLIYALDVGWYYEERTVSAVTTAVLAGIFAPGLLFGMGLLFLIAGLCTPAAFARKGPSRFAIDRAWRLGAPAAVYLLVVNPAMGYAGDRLSGEGQDFGSYLRETYRDDVALGVAWFVVALLVFSLGYAGWRARHPALTRSSALPARTLLVAGGAIVVGSYLIRIVWPFLATDAVLGLNLWEYPQMLALFTLGALASERGWLAQGLPTRLRRGCAWAAVAGAVLAAVLGVVITVTDEPEPFIGGLRVQALALPIVEAMVTLGASLWAVDWFRRRGSGGALIGAMAAGSFGAYLVHAPITVALAGVLRGVAVAGEVKLALVLVLAVAGSFWIGWRVSRSHLASRIL